MADSLSSQLETVAAGAAGQPGPPPVNGVPQVHTDIVLFSTTGTHSSSIIGKVQRYCSRYRVSMLLFCIVERS